MIVPYPPGIPVICPGEVITEDVLRFLDEQIRKGRHLHGLENEDPDGIAVVKETKGNRTALSSPGQR
jgi:arginine/lysine/ornithine decarboxylase